MRSPFKEQRDFVGDFLEGEAFYELMQAYRHAPLSNFGAVTEAYEAVKEFIRDEARTQLRRKP